MKVSTKGRYALRIMVEIATYDPADYVPLRALAESQDISEKYLEAIIAPMVRAGLLAGQRGKGGGYKLARTPEEYTAAEILRAAEGSLAPVSCLEGVTNVCPRAGQCATLDLWTGLDKVINDYLESVTLEDLVKKETARAGGDYII
ncbi:MAG: Rrf2 family transcriptional regulator [Clostridiales bacterium]|nr:Rrf2 family transcriptional regulator [Clostridiales bacterium]